jgi:hypothetical protein
MNPIIPVVLEFANSKYNMHPTSMNVNKEGFHYHFVIFFLKYAVELCEFVLSRQLTSYKWHP